MIMEHYQIICIKNANIGDVINYHQTKVIINKLLSSKDMVYVELSNGRRKCYKGYCLVKRYIGE